MKNIYILIGPPLSGKETQGELLERSLGGIPRFSMGHLIRDAKNTDEVFKKAYSEYSLQGKHLPNEIKFPLLASKMDTSSSDFILDNFPATAQDVSYLENYIQEKQNAIIKCVVSLTVSEEEMRKRFEIAKEKRGRADDTFEIVHERREIQDRDRRAVLDHYKNLGLLVEVNGEQSVEQVHNDIISVIRNKHED